MTRPEALAALLARHPVERAYVLTQPGRPDSDAIKRDLGTAYVERRRQEWTDGDISCVVSTRRLRIVRRA